MEADDEFGQYYLTTCPFYKHVNRCWPVVKLVTPKLAAIVS